MNVIHEEKQRFSLMIALFIAFSAVVIGLYLIISWRRGGFSEISGASYVILIVLFVFDLFFLANFFQLKVKVTDELLIFGFGLMKKKINLSDIENTLVEKFVFHKYMGYGIKIARDRTIGYIAGSGDGVYIQTSNKNFFITSDDAVRLKSMIDRVRSKSAPGGR